MEELKGFDKIDEIINNYVNQFGCDAELDEDFCYWEKDNIIGYTLIVGEFSDKVWEEYILETFNYTVENIFILSLFHELGHHFTTIEFNKEQRRKENIQVTKIETLLAHSKTKEEDSKLYKTYFNLPMERKATNWAIDYITNHQVEVNQFWEQLNKALKEFYKLNLDTEELLNSNLIF